MELSFLCYTAVDQLFLHSQAIWYRQESRWSRSGVHVGWEDWLPEWQCRPNICLGMYLSPCSVIYSYLLCSFWKFENGDNNSSLTELFRRWDEAKWERSQALCRSSRCDLGLFFPTYVLAAACTWGLSLSLSPSLTTAWCYLCWCSYCFLLYSGRAELENTPLHSF